MAKRKKKIRLRPERRWVYKRLNGKSWLCRIITRWWTKNYLKGAEFQKWLELSKRPEYQEKYIAVFRQWHWAHEDLRELFNLMEADCKDKISFEELCRRSLIDFKSKIPMVMSQRDTSRPKTLAEYTPQEKQHLMEMGYFIFD